jgi:nucleoid-associated protein YgaU
LALGIVVGGIALASVIGRPDPSGEAKRPGPGEEVMLRRRADPSAAFEPFPSGPPSRQETPRQEAPVASVTRFSGPRDASAVVAAEKSDVLPPALAKSFPDVSPPVTARWGTSMGIRLPEATAAEAVSVHKIVNGDTLPALAQQYLGSANRAGEIYEANRGLLTSPDALPIGLELRIPPRQPSRPPQASVAPQSLVPIPPRKP